MVVSSSKLNANEKPAAIDVSKEEGSRKKKPFVKRILKPSAVGAVFGLVYMLLQNGPLFRYEWVYSFYGLLLLTILVSFRLGRGLGATCQPPPFCNTLSKLFGFGLRLAA